MNKSEHLTCILLALSLAAFGCVSDTVPDEARVVDLDSKSDMVLRLDVSAIDIFRMDCDFEACRFLLFLEGDVSDGLRLGAGPLSAVQALRQEILTGAPVSGSATVEEQLVEVAEGMGTAFIEVPRGSTYGMVYRVGDGPTPTLEATLRLVPALAGATQLPQVDVGHYSVTSIMVTEPHAWSLQVSDVLDFFDPEVVIAVTGTAADLGMSVYYQCTSDGTTIDPGAVDTAWSGDSTLTFAPDCPTFDDGGAVYIEVRGAATFGSDPAVYTLSARIGGI